MILADIKARIHSMQNISLASESRSLLNDINVRWHSLVLNRLRSLVLEPLIENECTSSLQMLLLYFGDVSKCSLISYTDQPNSDITQLLVDIAYYVNPGNPLSVLMLGVVQESIDDKYPDLNELDLRALLTTHILSDNGIYLYPAVMMKDVELLETKKIFVILITIIFCMTLNRVGCLH